MKLNWDGLRNSSPFHRKFPWNHRSPYFLVNMALHLIWASRIVSPGAWWGSAFSYQTDDGRYFSRSRQMEVYLLGVFLLGCVMALIPTAGYLSIRIILITASLLFISEIIAYHFYLMAMRPQIDPSYTQYSSIRTIILTFLAYVNVINFYSVLYRQGIPLAFGDDTNALTIWAYSTGEMVGSGYPAVRVTDGIWLALLSGSQKIIGVYFLAIIIALCLGRIGLASFNQDPSQAAKKPVTTSLG